MSRKAPRSAIVISFLWLGTPAVAGDVWIKQVAAGTAGPSSMSATSVPIDQTRRDSQSAARLADPDQANVAIARQNGDGNLLSMMQIGGGGFAEVSQSGASNVMSIWQAGSRNVVHAVQVGAGNHVSIMQR